MVNGVLLYYHYVDLEDQQVCVHKWMQETCDNLQLRGRVRVAKDGINATVTIIMLPL
jgi:predicted sulfurtransferase